VALDATSYRAQLAALLPLGAAWPRRPDAAMSRQLAAWAEELARIDARSDRLVSEAMPSDALELLSDWERVAGLPDDCGAELSTTLAERRQDLVAALTRQGGVSLEWWRSFAARLGYADVLIEEFRPFTVGLSRCGDALWGDEDNLGHGVRHQWRIRVPGSRYTPFRSGVSQCADRLGKIVRAEDLECRAKRYKQAHTHLIFSYEGA
jgi:uncharacterized protein YmfQ (DUF2313 family)